MEVDPDLAIYSAVNRPQIVGMLDGSVRRQWNGDLLMAPDRAVVLARLWSPRWQIVAPNRLRREVRRRTQPNRRRPWSRQNVPAGALLFIQRRARSSFMFAGQLADSRTFGHGVDSLGGHYSKAWTDFEMRPPLSNALWEEMRSRALYIDDKIYELPDQKVMGPPELFDVLTRSLEGELVVVRIADRVHGTIIYDQRGEGGRLTHELGRTVKVARVNHRGQGFDALMIFWDFGELSPYVRWSSRAGG